MASNRIKSRDMFLLLALWMEHFPVLQKKDATHTPVGAVLVSATDRVLSLDHSGESHAIVRAILRSNADASGCDVYVSRFPCSLCVKIMVQAGIRRCYYFPAKDWERHHEPSDLSSPLNSPNESRKDRNMRSIQRLISNNPIALTLYIPQWDCSEVLGCDTRMTENDDKEPLWELDPQLENDPSVSDRWESVSKKFEKTQLSLKRLRKKYNSPLISLSSNINVANDPSIPSSNVREKVLKHAMVLAKIASSRTDDPKIGVGAVLVDQEKYLCLGWNGYPKKAQSLDYPQAGADDEAGDDELKYDYILHAEQNALLWRSPSSPLPSSVTIVSTKMPCDECSPIIHDCGIYNVVTNKQPAKSPDDPATLRGLTYYKITKLMKSVRVFDL